MPKKKKTNNNLTSIGFQERLLVWLRKICTIQFLGFIFGAVSCLATVWMLFLSIDSKEEKTLNVNITKIDSLRNCIEKKIAIIEKTFKPSIIPEDLDTINEKGLIIVKDFQMNSLKLVKYWKEIKNSPPLSKFNYNEEDIAEAQSWQLSIIEEYNNLVYIIMDDIEALDLYAYEINRLNYNVNKSKWITLINLEKKREHYNDSITRLCTGSWMIVSSKESKKRLEGVPYDLEYYTNLKGALEYENIRKENEVKYEFDNYLFDLIISQNKMYEITVNEYLQQRKK